MIEIRPLEESDYAAVRAVLNDWGDGVNLLPLFPRHVFVHFRDTQFLALNAGAPCGIISGFLSQTHADEAYVRVIALAHEARGAGTGRHLYDRFFQAARRHGRRIVRAITAPENTASVAFHRALGFDIEPGDMTIDGLTVHRDHAGPGLHRVLLMKFLHD